MNKAEMIVSLKDKGIDNAKEVYETFMNVIAESLQDDEEVVLHGIGKLVTENREARKGRNPKTGEAIKIPAKRVAKFKASQTLKTSLNG